MMALITTRQAADKLGVHITRIQQFIKAKRLPFQRYGRDYLIDESDLDSLVIYEPGRPSKTGKKVAKKTGKKSKKGTGK